MGGKRRVWKRLMSWIMVMCLAITLCPIDMVKAEGTEPTGTPTGTLVIATNFEECDGEVTWHDETNWNNTVNSATWHGSIDQTIGSFNCYFGIQNEQKEVTYITKENLKQIEVAYATVYREAEGGTNNISYESVKDLSTYLTFDDVHYWTEEGEQTYDNMISLKIKKDGAYKLTYGGSDLYINAGMPRFGFYTSDEASDEAFIDGTLEYSSEKGSVTFQAILDVNPNEYEITGDSVTCVNGNNEKFEIEQDSTSKNVFHITFQPKDMEDEEGAEFKVTFNRKTGEAVEEENAETQPAEEASEEQPAEGDSENQTEEETKWISLKKLCQGLVICDPDWDNGYGMRENPEYRKSIDQVILGSKREFYIGTLSDDGEFTPIASKADLVVNSDILTITKHADPEKDGLYDITFNATGSCSISSNYGAGTSSVDVTVVENKIKFYEDEACTAELEWDELGAYLWRNEKLTEAYVKIASADGERVIADAIYVNNNAVDSNSQFSDENITIEKTNIPYLYKITRTGAPEWESYTLVIRYQPNSEEAIGDECQYIELKLNLEDAFVGEGLYATEDLAYDIDWNVTGIGDGANWFKNRNYPLGGVNVAFCIKDSNGKITEEMVPVDSLKIYEATRDESGTLTISTEESQNATIRRYRARPDIAELRFMKNTIFVVRYIPAGKENEADNYQIVFDVTEGFPHAGWYTQPEISLENLIMDSSGYTVENGQNTIYLILKKTEGFEYVESEKLTTVVNESINQLANSSVFTIEKYDGTIVDAQAAFKVTIKTKMACSIGLDYNIRSTYYDEGQDKDVTEIENWKSMVNVSYKGEDAIDNYEGDVIRYEGEDGTDLIGFSGAFISKESYESGQTWFKGRFPEGIFYWVHGRTIQDVVDKLLAVAGTKVEVYDHVAQREATITIPNSGYIELNMSYRDTRYKDTYQAEQYVYAPASIKGIMMTTAENSYQIQRLDTEGHPFYQDEDCSGDDLTYYDDVLELPLTDEAVAAVKGTAKKLDGTTDSENMQIVHGICLQMDEGTEEEFDPDTLAALKKLLSDNGGTWDSVWADPEYTGPYIVQKTIYDQASDTWEKTDYFYVLSNGDLKVDVWGEETPLLNRGILQQPHRWPSLHVNASTQVRIQGLWQEGAQLYIGFYDGEDTVYSDAYDRRFTNADIGKNETVTFEKTYLRVYDAEKNQVETIASMTSDVAVHVVKAESNTNIADTYSEGDKKASIVVDKEAISDFVPMDEEETKQIIDGGTLDVDMSISKLDPQEGSEASTAIGDIDKKLDKNASGHAVDYVNVDLDYKIKANNGNGNGQSKKITETNEPIIISVPLNSSMKDKKNYYVYRHHDGKVEKLEAWIDEETGNLCFETDKFSVYAIAGDGSGTSSGGSGSGGTSSGGTSSGGIGTGDNPSNGAGTGGSSNTETKPDGTKVETSTEVKPDGTKVETTVETKPDGTKVETSIETKSDGSKIETNAETKADGSKVENVVETAKDGSVKTTETVTKADGSATKTEKETETNAKGKEVVVTTITEKDTSGKVTGITQTSEIERISGTASATVTVEKAADGKITSAEAEVDKKGASSKKGVTATLSGSVVSQITEAAETKSVEISMTVTAGKKEYTVKADAQDLEAGNKLKVMAIDEKTGKHILVNAKTYTVNKSGSVKLTLPAGMTYQLMDSKEAAAVEKQILATVKAKKTAATIAKGKKTTLKLSSKLDMDNVEKITYSSAKKSVATVSKTGKITGKNGGTVVITAKVTLKNGKTKNVKMKITVN